MIKDLESYRDIFLAENIMNGDFIGFYTREFYCLDNFSAFKFEFGGKVFQTVEHAYQSYKFIHTAPEIAKQIIESNSPHDAKKIADLNKDKVDPNWQNINIELMEKLLRAKMEQNPTVKEKLLKTKGHLICEDSPKDSFWGIGPNRDGRNELGKLWMKLRDEINKS